MFFLLLSFFYKFDLAAKTMNAVHLQKLAEIIIMLNGSPINQLHQKEERLKKCIDNVFFFNLSEYLLLLSDFYFITYYAHD